MPSSDAYSSAYIEDCVRMGHHFTMFGSDVKPLKRHLACRECSLRTGKTVMVAHGDGTTGFGQWREAVKREKETFSEEV